MKENITTSLMENTFIKKRLQEARIYRGLSQSELGELIGCSKQIISNYETRDEYTPNSNILCKVSAALDFPIDFFYKEDQNCVELGQVFFRSQSIPAKKKEMLKQRLKYLNSEIVNFLENYIYLPKVNLIDIGYKTEYTKNEISDIAHNLRIHWELGNKPIDNLMSTMLKNGCIIARLSLDSEKTDGYSCWISNRPYSLLNTEKHGAVRARFTLAHELGHIVLHKNLNNNEDIKRRESEANFFASEFLFPSEEAINEISYVSLDSLLPIKNKWKISIAALVRRCYDLELITDDRYTLLQKQISKRKWRKLEPLDDIIKPEQPKIYKEAFNLLIENKIITKEEILRAIKYSEHELVDMCGLEDDFFEDKLQLKPKLQIVK